TTATAAAAVIDAVGSRGVPRHADEERTVMAVVRRPPVLRVGHQDVQVLNHGIEIKALKLLGVVELFAHRIGKFRLLMQTCKVQSFRPPVAVAPYACRCVLVRAVRKRALRFGGHDFSCGRQPFAGCSVVNVKIERAKTSVKIEVRSARDQRYITAANVHYKCENKPRHPDKQNQLFLTLRLACSMIKKDRFAVLL